MKPVCTCDSLADLDPNCPTHGTARALTAEYGDPASERERNSPMNNPTGREGGDPHVRYRNHIQAAHGNYLCVDIENADPLQLAIFHALMAISQQLRRVVERP